MTARIKVAEAQLVGNEEAYVLECVRSGWLSAGPFVARLEQEFMRATGAAHALACANGTVALHLALLACGVGPGDEVIVPGLTYVATANAVRHSGATPVFADIDLRTWCMRPDEARRLLRKNTAAILPVHLYGAMPDMDALRDVALDANVALIEDAAEAFGSRSHGRHAGTLGRAGTFSFFGNKTLTCGEGGMVTFADEEDCLLARRLSRQGVQAPTPGQHWYSHDLIGYNYRLTDLQAAVALAQLESREWHLRRRDDISAFYRAAAWPEGTVLQEPGRGIDRSPWMFTVLVPQDADRDTVLRRMNQAGVETRPTFQTLTRLPMYGQVEMLRCCDEVTDRGLSLPTHGALSAEDLARVVGTFAEAVEFSRRLATEVQG